MAEVRQTGGVFCHLNQRGRCMSFAQLIIFLFALAAAVGCAIKALWHGFGMVRGVRASSEWWVNFVPFIALALLGALDLVGQMHRAKFARWAGAAVVFAAVAGDVQFSFWA